MSLGHLLLKPQQLPRLTTAESDEALIMDVLATIARLSADKAQGGTMVDDIEAAFEALGQRLLDHAGGGLTRAVLKLNDLARPLARLTDEIPALFDGDAAAIADKLLDLLGKLADLTGQLTIDHIRARTEVVVDVLQHELGLDSATLEAQFWLLLDDIVARLETVPDDANRMATAGAMRRIARRARGAVHLPELNADRLASALFAALTPYLGPELKKVACAGRAAGDVLDAIRAVRGLVPFTGFGSHSIGAGEAPPDLPEREYLWYATYLLGDKDVEWYQLWKSAGDVWIDRTGTSVQSRHRMNRIWLTDAFSWTDIPIGDGKFTYSFKHLSPEVMEKIAFHSAWGAELDEALLHIWSPLGGVQITKGGQVSVTDLLDSLFGGGQVALKLTKKMPLSFLVGVDHWYSGLVGWSPRIAAHLAGSFQGFHTKADGLDAFKMWIVILVPFDAMRALSANSLPSMIRETLLSLLTLYNYDGPTEAPVGDDTRPLNRRQTAGLAAWVEFFMTMAMVKAFYDRRYYGLPFSSSSRVDDFLVKVWCEYWLLMGTLFGVLNGFLGTAFAQSVQAIMGSPATDWGLLGLNILKATVKNLLMFWINVYIWRENDTGGGTFNPDGTDFLGYPDQDSSPYLLPWTGGDTIVCSQGNQGLFSHNNVSAGKEQVYAYDFHLDKGDKVRAARAGVVVDYFDSVPNSKDEDTSADFATVSGQTTNDSKNFIVIRHDTASDAHDKGPGGAKVTTYAVYMHGLHSGVRDAFADRATPEHIIGTAVAQGDVIMLADSTGNSLCNHVHMQVMSGPSAGSPVMLSSLGSTIPFVFKDGGQPSSRAWLKSENAS